MSYKCCNLKTKTPLSRENQYCLLKIHFYIFLMVNSTFDFLKTDLYFAQLLYYSTPCIFQGVIIVSLFKDNFDIAYRHAHKYTNLLANISK